MTDEERDNAIRAIAKIQENTVEALNAIVMSQHWHHDKEIQRAVDLIQLQTSVLITEVES